MNFIDRLKTVCDTNNVAEIARMTGVPYNTLKNYSGNVDRLPSGEVLLMIAETTNVNINYLLTGEGETFCRKRGNNNKVNSLDKAENPSDQWDAIIEVEVPSFKIRLKVSDLITNRTLNTIPIFNSQDEPGEELT